MRNVRIAVLPALFAVACLSACSSGPSAADLAKQDRTACQDWSGVITDWTDAGGGQLAAEGAASKLSSKVIPEASPSLAKDMKVVARAVARYEQVSSAATAAASTRLGSRCKAVGAPLTAD